MVAALGFPSTSSGSDGNPHQHNDDVHALVLATLVLVRPHAVRLLVPVCAASAVHAAAAHVWLAIGGGRGASRVGAGRSGLGGALLAGRGTLRLVQLRGGDEVLDDGAVDRKLKGGCSGLVRGRLGDDSAEHIVLPYGW